MFSRSTNLPSVDIPSRVTDVDLIDVVLEEVDVEDEVKNLSVIGIAVFVQRSLR